MSRKHIFLHIGTHKTATTTIQAGCVENRDALLAAGFLYPTTGIYLFGQHHVAWEMAEGRPQPWNHVSKRVAFSHGSGDINALMDEIDGSTVQNVIISSEDFDGLHEDRIQLLCDSLRKYDVEVIVYFREQTSLWPSAWTQFIKSGFVSTDFTKWAEELLASPQNVLRYFGRYDLFLSPWVKSFGKENIIIRRYGVDAYGGTIFYDFLRTCRVPDVNRFTVPGNQNVSPGLPALELSRFLAQNEVDPSIRSKICWLVQCFLRENGGIDGKFHLVNADLSRRMYHYFLPHNQSVAKEYLGLEELFHEPHHDKTVTQFSIDEIDTELVQEMKSFIGVELGKI